MAESANRTAGSSVNDKRRTPRYLCNDAFQRCRLSLETDGVALALDCTPINYHRYGIGIVVIEHLPEFDQCELSFEWNGGEEVTGISALPASVVFRHDSDIGIHFGLEFSELNWDEPGALESRLIEIESSLSQSGNDEDRYGL